MIIQLLTYLLLFVVPLIVIPGIDLRFEPPKVLVTELLIEFLLVFVILKGKFAFKRTSRTLAIVIACLFLLSLFHLILSPTSQNVYGNVFRLQGTILFWHLLICALITQNTFFRLKEKYIYMCSFIGLLLGSLIYGSNSAGRLVGSLGEPNALGAVVIMVFPFVFLNFKSVWIRTIGIIGALGILNYSQSRSALIALGLELLFILIIKFSKGKYLLASIIVFILLGLSILIPILDRQYFLITNPLSSRYEDRAEIWQVALLAGLDSPIFGSGIESIQEKIHTTAQKINVTSQYEVIDSSHNLLLDYWIWGGAIGLIFILSLIILSLKKMISKKMLLEMTLLLGLLTVLSFNPTTVSILVALWWVVGRSFAAVDESNNS